MCARAREGGVARLERLTHSGNNLIALVTVSKSAKFTFTPSEDVSPVRQASLCKPRDQVDIDITPGGSGTAWLPSPRTGDNVAQSDS